MSLVTPSSSGALGQAAGEAREQQQVGLEGMGRQRQQPPLLVGEDVGHGPIALLGMGAWMRDLVTPAPKLRVEIVDVDKRPRRKEGMAQVLNLALDLPLFIRAARGTRSGGKVIVAGELEQPRVEADVLADPLEDLDVLEQR